MKLITIKISVITRDIIFLIASGFMFTKIIPNQYWIKNDHKLTIKIRNKILFVGRATCLTSLSVKAQISSFIIASINSSQAIKALIMIKFFSIKSHQPSNANSLSLLKVLFTSDDGVIKTIRCLSNICNRLNLEFIKKRNNNFTKLVFSLVFQLITLVATSQNAGPSIEMDGTNDYITMGGNSTLAVSSSQGRSFLMDFKPDNYGAALISRYVNFSSGSSSFSIAINSSGKVVVTGNGLNDINSTNAVALNQWQRLAVTISSSGQAKIYIDGILDGSGTITLNSSIPSTVLTLGTFNSTQLTNRYDGTLDNLVIWDGEMTAAEVSSYSTCLPLASSTDVIGKWSFEEESGTIAADSVGTLSGTLTSAALWSNDTSTIVCTTNLCTDTISVSILDTTIIFDTSYVDVFDTNYVDVFDTNYVDVFDTNYVDVFDTIFITQIDTSYLTVTDTLIIDVSLIGINPLVFEYQVLIYPNPTNSILYIEIPQSMTGQLYRIELVNPIGQLIYSSQLNQQQLQINLSSFASAGTYTLLLKDSGGTVVDTRVIILQ